MRNSRSVLLKIGSIVATISCACDAGYRALFGSRRF